MKKQDPSTLDDDQKAKVANEAAVIAEVAELQAIVDAK
jgi:hypothetical protein